MLSWRRLRKAKRSLRLFHRLYKRKAKSLNPSHATTIQEYLHLLQGAILKKDSHEAKRISHELAASAERLMPKSSWDKLRDFTTGMLVALLIAVVVRTMWFEFYTIPSGSMRPTLKEEDYLVVSKTDYGINVPLQARHFYFDPTLVKRGSIVVFNGENMDITDADTMYFYLFPGKKQFVKRLIGKPGDRIYFYGGDLYGIDSSGNEIAEFRNPDWFLEHIPYIRLDGKVDLPAPPQNGLFSSVIFNQMNQPVAKLNVTPIGTVQGEMIAPIQNYNDFLGIKHYAMARLLNKTQMEKIYPEELKNLEEGLLYLELIHHPTTKGASLIRDEYNRMRPELATSTSLIPLQKEHLQAIVNHMTTCRFQVKNGLAWRLGWNPKELSSYLPKLPGVPDGTYEIQDGKATKLPFPTIPIVGLFTNGITVALDKSHPLYKQDPEQILKLYDLGIEFINQYLPFAKNQRTTPSRYAYFKDGDLYLLASPIIKKEDPTLQAFHKREQLKQALSTSVNPYHPFADAGQPSREEILKNGIRIPEKMYLVLGDNHAMSADSRQFGFVPEDNLKGGVSFIFSPPGERWGRSSQPAISHLSLPNITIWIAFILTCIASSYYYRKKYLQPFKF